MLPKKRKPLKPKKEKDSAEIILANASILPYEENIKSFAIALINPRSRNINIALSAMKRATNYLDKTDCEGNRIIVAEFMLNKHDLLAYQESLSLTSYWSTSFHFRDRVKLSRFNYDDVHRWIACFINSFKIEDKRAYCCRVFEDDRHKFLIPYSYTIYQSRFDYDHPSPLNAQYKAICIRSGYLECPGLNLENFAMLK